MIPNRILLLTAVSLATLPGIAQTAKRVHPHIAGFIANKILRDCRECPDLVVVPPGTFLMRSPSNEKGHFDEEGPQRRVKIAAFAGGKYDVTRRQWKDFVEATH